MKARTTTIVGFGAAALVALSATPSEALNTVRSWPRGTSYIYVSEGGVNQGRAYGTWKVADTSNGTRSIASANLQDLRVGGNSIYVELQTQSNSGICFSPEYTSCNQTWYNYSMDQTGRSNSDRWVTLGASTGVDNSDQYARGVLKVCEDQAYSPDPCSGWTYTYGDIY